MSRSLWQYRLYSALPLNSQPWHSCMVTKEEHGGINLSTEQPFLLCQMTSPFLILNPLVVCVCVCKCVGPKSECLHRAEQTILQGTDWATEQFSGKAYNHRDCPCYSLTKMHKEQTVPQIIEKIPRCLLGKFNLLNSIQNQIFH